MNRLSNIEHIENKINSATAREEELGRKLAMSGQVERAAGTRHSPLIRWISDGLSGCVASFCASRPPAVVAELIKRKEYVG
jgi:hypothetical protein